MALFSRILEYLFVAFLLLYGTVASVPRPFSVYEQIRAVVAPSRFDILSWEANAIWQKALQASIAAPRHLRPSAQKDVVEKYLQLVQDLQKVEHKIASFYADPAITDPQAASAQAREIQDALLRRHSQLAPLAESVLQAQVTEILRREALTWGGQPLPAVLYHSSPLPQYIILSPREQILSQYSYILLPDLPLQEAIRLEDEMTRQFNLSALTVNIGGLAAYPTMVMQTDSLRWLLEVISHEWVHLYFVGKPIDIHYGKDPQVRTMNETAASIAGKELSDLAMQTYYPERLSQPAPHVLAAPASFDFRAEMYTTRVRADELLAQGKVEEAEAYMEERRQVFWQNGYQIRKLNQAYFAFYGAYADTPGGAAGEDPVGPAVRALRERSATLKEFLDTLAPMDSFDDLQKALQETNPQP